MNILFLTNNNITLPLYEFLKNSDIDDVQIYKDRLTENYLKICNIEMVISYNYRFILTKDILDLLNGKAINLHISLLPWNRGAHPNFWSFIDNTPKGVTIHYIDQGLDTGDVILQKEMFFNEDVETLTTSYNTLHREVQKLFSDNWEQIRSFSIISKKQHGKSSYHNLKDFNLVTSNIGDEIWNLKISDLKGRLIK